MSIYSINILSFQTASLLMDVVILVQFLSQIYISREDILSTFKTYLSVLILFQIKQVFVITSWNESKITILSYTVIQTLQKFYKLFSNTLINMILFIHSIMWVISENAYLRYCFYKQSKIGNEKRIFSFFNCFQCQNYKIYVKFSKKILFL